MTRASPGAEATAARLRERGFDPLVEHLQSRGIHVRRHDDCKTLSFGVLKKPASELPLEPYSRVIAYLKKNVNNRPKKLKTLKNKLAELNGTIGVGDVDALVARLIKEKMIGVGEKEAVVYMLK